MKRLSEEIFFAADEAYVPDTDDILSQARLSGSLSLTGHMWEIFCKQWHILSIDKFNQIQPPDEQGIYHSIIHSYT